MTPFEVVYGKYPPLVLSDIPRVYKIKEVEKTLTFCATILISLKENLVMDLNRMKQQADQGPLEHQFVTGDHGFLCLQPYKKTSLKYEHYKKLSPKFYGPYAILRRVGHVAFQLSLSSDSNLHHVFHVS